MAWIYKILKIAVGKFPAAIFLCIFLAGCFNLNVKRAYESFDDLVLESGWKAGIIETTHFSLRILSDHDKPHTEGPLYIYLEGDGHAWINRRKISPDPSPLSPLVASLATLDHKHNSVYLARPCQYTLAVNYGANCKYPLWSDARFAEVVIDNMDQAIDELLKSHKADEAVLVGFSGGATLAMLLAARRDDIAGIVTIAGLLNHESWANYHDISPLKQSLNPPDYFDAIKSIPQWHLLGGQDDSIPNSLTLIEIRKLQRLGGENITYKIYPDMGHSCCWGDIWSTVLNDLTF